MPNFQDNQGESFEDERYLAMLAKPTNDEVGADIETYGHVPVTPETATQDPFTQKGSLANALDEITEPTEADSMPQKVVTQQTVYEHPELKEVATGEFGADMKVALVNDGPVTIIIDTKNKV